MRHSSVVSIHRCHTSRTVTGRTAVLACVTRPPKSEMGGKRAGWGRFSDEEASRRSRTHAKKLVRSQRDEVSLETVIRNSQMKSTFYYCDKIRLQASTTAATCL
jgi:hypothetical protein